MGKFSNTNQSMIKIPASQLREESGNVRKEYDWEEIENLAKSIQENGLLNPLTVKPGVMDNDGRMVYEIVCGHRRARALHILRKRGVDVGLVECCIRTGDTWTLQMIENIHRTDLSARDKESAIQQMLDKGLSQKEIADMLSKPISYVSDIIAGTKVRAQAEAAGVDTAQLKTRALAQLRSISAEELPGKVQELSRAGGTNAAATKILHEYKEANGADAAEPTETPDFGETAPRFKPGTKIDKIGKRLFWDDLYVGQEFTHASKGSHLYKVVCKITKIDGDYLEYVDGDNSCGKTAGTRKEFVDSSTEQSVDQWLYEIPDDAKTGYVSWDEWEGQLYQLKIGITFKRLTDAERCLELIQNNFSDIAYATKYFYRGTK